MKHYSQIKKQNAALPLVLLLASLLAVLAFAPCGVQRAWADEDDAAKPSANATLASGAIAAGSSASVPENHMSFTFVNPLYEGVFDESDIAQQPKLRAQADGTVYESIDDAAAYFREQMKNRVGSFKVSVRVSEDADIDDVLDDIFNAATAHTGKPDEGDYLRFQFTGYSVDISTYDYKTYVLNYSMTYLSTLEQEKAVDDAVKTVLERLDIEQLTDYDKAVAIYDYLRDSVTYDDTLTRYTAYHALVDHTAVCQGYAVALYRLLLTVGVDCRIVSGYAGGQNHAWNIIKLGHLYYDVDATWDSNMHTHWYFLKGDPWFSGEHEKDMEYLTEEFASHYPISPVDYDPGSSDGYYRIDNVTFADPVFESYVAATFDGNQDGWLSPTERANVKAVSISDSPIVSVEGIELFDGLESMSVTGTQVETLDLSTFQSLKSASLSGNERLAEISLPQNVTTIGQAGVNVAGCTKLETLKFRGAAPQAFDDECFAGIEQLTVYYPADDETWTDDLLQTYGSHVTWVAGSEENPGRTVTVGHVWLEGEGAYTVDIKPTCISEGSESIHCKVCGEIQEGSSRPIAKLESGWISENGKWYYYENGSMVMGRWAKDSKGWVYLGADGAMATDKWVKDSKGWCYVGSNGYMVADKWIKDSKGWCYLDSNGHAVTSAWKKISGKWYHFDSACHMEASKWVKDSKGWCYLGSNGAMVTNGWAKDSKGWCYLNASGYAVTNAWKQIKDTWYYFDANGHMVTGTQTINGKTYRFASNGAWLG